MSRWYAPAYRAENGNVIPCGTATVVPGHAGQAAAQMQQQWQDADPASPDVFVAWREMPEWTELRPPDCCGHEQGAHECGLCQVVLNGHQYVEPHRFCPCPINDRT